MHIHGIFVLHYYIIIYNNDKIVLLVVFLNQKYSIFLPNSGKWDWNNCWGCTEKKNCTKEIMVEGSNRGLDESWGQATLDSLMGYE